MLASERVSCVIILFVRTVVLINVLTINNKSVLLDFTRIEMRGGVAGWRRGGAM